MQVSNHLPRVGRVEARTAHTWRDEISADYGDKGKYRRRVRRMERTELRRQIENGEHS